MFTIDFFFKYILKYTKTFFDKLEMSYSLSNLKINFSIFHR